MSQNMESDFPGGSGTSGGSSTNSSSGDQGMGKLGKGCGGGSVAWKYFIFKNEKRDYVICQLCKSQLAYHKSTSTLLKHLRTRHAIEFLTSCTSDGSEVLCVKQ